VSDWRREKVSRSGDISGGRASVTGYKELEFVGFVSYSQLTVGRQDHGSVDSKNVFNGVW